MAYFARKLRYGAHDGEAGASYMALIELAKKKNGRPVGFVLYRRIIQYFYPAESVTEMIRLEVESAEEAIRRFWPWGKQRAGREFPGFNSDRWEKTTLWLNHVAAGGGYERYGYDYSHSGTIRLGDWVRVGTPAPWSKRRKKKKPLRFGLPAHIVLVDEARIRLVEEDVSRLMFQLNELESYDDEDDSTYVSEENQAAYELVEHEVLLLKARVASIRAKINALREKMRQEVRLRFPTPLGMIPKRVSRPKPESRHW
ncbi:MAG TPA: hypothetical protein PLW99_03150 [Candidatus Paceibacterota bacterium]|nr:MAG: hypothetical protein B7X03_01095 [Parcubacteria group bacterium 21-58-10]HQT83118.1 hypothetical protein [Candidatus Paceibacterota bacterium]